VSLNGRMTVNDKLERIWKEKITACFKVLHQHYSEEIDKN
jgi:hypothetical protein